MKTIQKGREPRSLTEHRANTNADYDNYKEKDELRLALVTEQGAICCYCMQRIYVDGDKMKIEHWRCQSLFAARQLDYDNLLGACLGGKGQPEVKQHCDSKKGDQPLSKNPSTAGHRVEDLVHYLGTGEVDSPNKAFLAELNSVLNLNLPLLRDRRKAVLDAFLKSLPKAGELKTGWIKSQLNDWSSPGSTGDLRPFCMVVVYWLRKRLARASR